MLQEYLKKLPPAPAFNVTSADVENGSSFKPAQLSAMTGVKGAKDQSPQLSWDKIPEGTKSFAVTMYDLDAPTGSGFWHWAVKDIPASVTSLASDAGHPGGKGLPDDAVNLPNDARVPGYVGAAPAPGTGLHRYAIIVHALGIEKIDVPNDLTPAFLGMMMGKHILGRAVLEAVASAD